MKLRLELVNYRIEISENIRLNFTAFLLTTLRHTSGDLARVSLNAHYECMTEGMRLASAFVGLDDNYFLAGIATPGDEANSRCF